MDYFKSGIEIISAILILIAFELINRKSVKGFVTMAIGQFLAAIVCVFTQLWFLAAMHFVNFILMVRGYLKWKN